MAGEVFIAKESTSQAIKTQADNIKTVVDTINAKPVSTDILRLQPQNVGGYITSGGVGFKTVLNVTGKGLLNRAITVISDAIEQQIKITIDGTVKVFTSSKAISGKPTGFIKFQDIVTYTSSGLPYTNVFDSWVAMDYAFVGYPLNAIPSRNAPQMCVLTSDIPFLTSLLIEVTNTTNARYEVNYSLFI